MKRGKLKYSELMPPDTDNVLFNYHLQHLVKNGLLLKEDNFYSFTPEGWKATSHITYDGLYFRKFVCRFRLYVIDGDNVLLQHRAFSPFKGDTTGLSSQVMYGSTAAERANLRLKEKTGLSASMQLAGVVRTIIATPEKEVLDDSIYFIMYATAHAGTLNAHDDNGNPLAWYSFDKAIELERANKWSGDKTLEVVKRLKDKNYESFSFEEWITTDSL